MCSLQDWKVLIDCRMQAITLGALAGQRVIARDAQQNFLCIRARSCRQQNSINACPWSMGGLSQTHFYPKTIQQQHDDTDDILTYGVHIPT